MGQLIACVSRLNNSDKNERLARFLAVCVLHKQQGTQAWQIEIQYGTRKAETQKARTGTLALQSSAPPYRRL